MIWVRNLIKTLVGGADLNGVFDGGDLVDVFAASKYVVDPETAEMATWAEGDWDGDMFFDRGDLVLAFQDGADPHRNSTLPPVAGEIEYLLTSQKNRVALGSTWSTPH